MLCAYSLDLRERLIDAVDAGGSARAAARRFQVSASTAVKWVQRKRETGSVKAKPMHDHPPAKLCRTRIGCYGWLPTNRISRSSRSASTWRRTASMSAKTAFIPSSGGTASA